MAMVKKEFIKEAGEFKKFIARGNVIDMSVAVLVGGAFGKIISSLVNDVVMPLLGMILGKVNIAQLSITPSGVKRHREKMLLRNGCTSMMELVAKYIRLCELYNGSNHETLFPR